VAADAVAADAAAPVEGAGAGVVNAVPVDETRAVVATNGANAPAAANRARKARRRSGPPTKESVRSGPRARRTGNVPKGAVDPKGALARRAGIDPKDVALSGRDRKARAAKAVRPSADRKGRAAPRRRGRLRRPRIPVMILAPVCSSPTAVPNDPDRGERVKYDRAVRALTRHTPRATLPGIAANSAGNRRANVHRTSGANQTQPNATKSRSSTRAERPPRAMPSNPGKVAPVRPGAGAGGDVRARDVKNPQDRWIGRGL
jgi:hypothetical protein